MGEDYKQDVSNRLKDLVGKVNQRKYDEARDFYTDQGLLVEPGKKPCKAKDGQKGVVDMYIRTLSPGDDLTMDSVQMYKKDDVVINLLWNKVKDKDGKLKLEGNGFLIWKQERGEWCVDFAMWNNM